MKMNDPVGAARWPRELNKVPKDVFHQDDIYRLEQQRIFQQEWFPVAHIAEVPLPGDFKTTRIGEASVLVLHGEDGVLRVFENACPHRGTQLQTCARGSLPVQQGTASIECPYHRWSFSTQGELQGAPGIRDFPPDFRKEDYGMRRLRSGSVHGVVFATFNREAPELDEYLGEVVPYIDKALGGHARLKFLGYQNVTFSTNWKEYSDNEGYHAPLLHRAFQLLKWQGGKGRQFMTAHAHKVIAADLSQAPDSGFLSEHSLIEARDTGAPLQSVVISLFPLTSFIRHLDVISMRFAMPRTANKTDVQYAYFASAEDGEEMLKHRVRQSSNLLGPSGLISLEDGAVFNRLHAASRVPGTVEFQKGVQDRFAAPTMFQQNDEAGNVIRWERYRTAMGFSRA
jgi:anthranilate 1,2-dioxygenase large subunit